MHSAANKLEAVGLRLGYPHSSAVKGKDGKGFRELRPRSGNSKWRPIYRRVGDTDFVIFSVAPEAQINAPAYEKAVRAAKERFEAMEE